MKHKISPTLLPLLTGYQGINSDSRQIKQGYIFVAMPKATGALDSHSISHNDIKNEGGWNYIKAALTNGATAVILPTNYHLDQDTKKLLTDNNTALFFSSEIRRDLSLLAAHYAKQLPKEIILITGTNGKSSSVHIARELWHLMGRPAASIGTLGVYGYNKTGEEINKPAYHTTPDAGQLYQDLHELWGMGINNVAIEASSHGLHQYRLDGIMPSAAALSELSQDHLDYHKTLEHYYQAKLRLFQELLPRGAKAVFLEHSPVAQQLSEICKARQLQKIMISRNPYSKTAEVVITNITPIKLSMSDIGATMELEFRYQDEDFATTLPMPAEFQAENALLALFTITNSVSKIRKILPYFAKIPAIRGRMESVGKSKGAEFFVDYAHTPAALETALNNLRPFVGRHGKLIVVFGCGGNRDTSKRPKMGHIADRLADVVIVTDDNPRDESPASIRAAILATCDKAIEAKDRYQAINMAIKMAEAGDIILVAGKGHETGQTIGKEILPFDDKAVIQEILKSIN